jgi:hypothetical protein
LILNRTGRIREVTDKSETLYCQHARTSELPLTERLPVASNRNVPHA